MYKHWISAASFTILGAIATVGCSVQTVDSDDAPTTEEVSTAEQGVGQACGGIAGLQCPSGYVCVDDPSDSCNPRAGDADCIGVCVRPRAVLCQAKHPGAVYISTDPAECAAISFVCVATKSPFSDFCGCGCE